MMSFNDVYFFFSIQIIQFWFLCLFCCVLSFCVSFTHNKHSTFEGNSHATPASAFAQAWNRMNTPPVLDTEQVVALVSAFYADRSSGNTQRLQSIDRFVFSQLFLVLIPVHTSLDSHPCVECFPPISTLNEFGETPQAWEVCRSILADTTRSAPLLFYAASTLRRKLERGHLAQLPTPAHAPLRGMLLAWTAAVATRADADPAFHPVLGALAAAVAAFCAQAPAQVWRTPVDDVLALEDGGGNSDTAVLALLEALPAALSPRAVLTGTPEGAAQHRARLTRHFAARFSPVCAALARVLARRGTHDARTACAVFVCGAAWLGTVPATPDALAAAPLPAAAFDALACAPLADAAADCLGALVHAAARHPGARGLALRTALVARLSACCALLGRPCAPPRVLHALARVLADVGEACAAELAAGALPAAGVAALVLLFLQAGPAVPRDTLALALQPFHAVCRCVTANASSLVPLQHAFADVVQPISVCALRLLVLPAHVGDGRDNDEDSEEDAAIKDFRRHDVAELMRDCTTVVGSDVMVAALLERLESERARAQWRAVEALLFGLRAVARCADIASAAVTPVFDCAMQLPRADVRLQATALLAVGRYADWLAHAPDRIAPLLAHVVSFLPVRRLQRAAALAFQRVCLACPGALAAHAPDFLRVYQSCCAEWALGDAECDQVVCGLGCVFRHDPAATLTTLVATLRTFARADVAAVQAARRSGLSPPSACFRRLGTLVRAFLPQRGERTFVCACGAAVGGEADPRTELVAEWWGALARPFLAAFAALPRDVAEQLCRLCRKTLLACLPALPAVLPGICAALVDAFGRPGQQHPALLSVLSCVVRAYARAGSALVPDDVQAVLLHALECVSGPALARLEASCACANPAAAADETDLVKEFLELLTCAMGAFPGAFFCAAGAQGGATARLLLLVQRTVAFVPRVLVRCPEQTAVTMVLMFLERLFLLCACPAYAPSLAALLSRAGVPLVRALVHGAVVQPESVLPSVCAVLRAAKRFDAESLVAWLAAALGIDVPPEFAFVFPASCPEDTGAPPALPFRVTAQACTEFVVGFCRTEGPDSNSSARLLSVLEFFVGECRRY